VGTDPARDRRAAGGAGDRAAVADERVADRARTRRRGKRPRPDDRAPVDVRQDEHGAAVAGDELRRLGRRDGGDLVARGAVVEFHDPHVDAFRDGAGASHRGRDLDSVLDGSNVVVILVRHAAIDWDRVYDRARLIVDTVNSSAGRQTRGHQVRRLGAGWSTEAPAVAEVEGVGSAEVPA
jgi:hypothetical protein